MPVARNLKYQVRKSATPKSAFTAHSALDVSRALKQLPVNLAVLNARGTIVDVNEGWKKFARDNGLRTPNFGIGKNYINVCRSGSGAPAELAENLERLIAAQLDLINLVYSCGSPTEARWFSLIALRLPFNGLERVVVLHINISDLVRSPFGASFTQTLNADSRDRLLLETQIAASAVHCSVDRSLKSQLKKTHSDQSLRSSINTIGRQAASAELTRVNNGLTKRQQEVFLLLGKGKTNAEIAQALFRSPNTIKLHVSAILKTLDVKNRTQAALLASRLFEHGSG